MRSFLLLVVAWAGCSATRTSMGLVPPGDDGGGPPPTGDLAAPEPPADMSVATTLEISIGPIDLQPGDERTICSVFRLPTTRAGDLVQIDATLLPGSHHLIFYRSNETNEQRAPFECAPLGDVGFGGGNPPNIPLYIAETLDQNTLPLPAGVAYRFAAAQMVKLEAHYINATPRALVGQGTVRLTFGPTARHYVPADIMFCGSVVPLLLGIPPGRSSLPPAFYQAPAGIKVFGLTAHQHHRGTLMTIAKSSGASDPGTKLLDGTPWDNEPFQIYDDQHLVSFAKGEGLRWQCFYDNPDQTTIRFGESGKSDEMCFLWAYYFPSVGRFLGPADCWR